MKLCNSGKLADLLPSKIVPGENETLLRQEKLFQGKVIVERVSLHLNGSLDYDSEAEERPASPAQESETLFAVILNVSVAKRERFLFPKQLYYLSLQLVGSSLGFLFTTRKGW